MFEHNPQLWDPLGEDVVPVVLGGADYAALAPPHSYIDIQQFSSAREAGLFLLHLIDTPDEYLKVEQDKLSYKLILGRVSTSSGRVITD